MFFLQANCFQRKTNDHLQALLKKVHLIDLYQLSIDTQALPWSKSQTSGSVHPYFKGTIHLFAQSLTPLPTRGKV